MKLALELDFHRVTRPWRRTLTNGSDVKCVFPRCRVHCGGSQILRYRTKNVPITLLALFQVEKLHADLTEGSEENTDSS